MRFSKPTISSHFRAWAAVMLWVWLVSQSVCVAHCHGVFIRSPQTNAGKPSASHGCCARLKSPERVKSSKAADTSNPSDQAPSDAGRPCSSKAVIQWSISLETPTWTPVSLPFPPTIDWILFGLGVLPSQYRTAVTEARWADKSLPRWDAVFEPSVMLGSGLQSLAPPFEA
jgi:hypothetical protein